MLKNFITAASAKSQTQIALDNSVQNELQKLQEVIQTAIEQGEFSVEWKVSNNLTENQINHILEFLVNREYCIFFKDEKRVKFVNRIEMEIPRTLKGVFERKEIVFDLNWKSTFEEYYENRSYFDVFNPQRSDMTARV